MRWEYWWRFYQEVGPGFPLDPFPRVSGSESQLNPPFVPEATGAPLDR